VVFLLSVAAIVSAVKLVVAAIIRLYADPLDPQSIAYGGSFVAWTAEHGALLAAVAAATALFIALASAYRMATLSRGGAQVARMLGGTEVTVETQDRLRQRLINIVEEMAIASGIPVPDVFVLEEEQGINAFAAGLTTSDAAVAVTRGAIEKLNRAELQGVVAHEFSHIVNGDMRLNLRLMGLSFGILVLALIGRWLIDSMRFTRRTRSHGGFAAVVALGLSLTLVGYVGLFFGRLIKAGVSRQREMLADASAVQFTRDSTGLAGALKKIGGYTGRLTSRDSEEIAHMLFSRGSSAFRGWFATHPPIDERIQALDPSFRPGDYPEISDAYSAADDNGAVLVHALASTMVDSDPLESAGHPASQAVARALHVAIPDEIYHAAHSRDTSLLLVVALALAHDSVARARQSDFVEQQLGSARAKLVNELRQDLDALDPVLTLPVLELAMPAIRNRPPAQLEFLASLLRRIARLNPEERLFDFVLLRLLESYLWDLPGVNVTPPKASRGLSLGAALVALLRCVAAFGHEDGDSALAAFRAGLNVVTKRGTRVAEPSFEPLAEACSLTDLEAALARLAAARPHVRGRVLRAVLTCIQHDHRIELAEHELFRAIAATLGCPIPPAASTSSSQ
ncbi:MAG TPA: M48 family metallopeptidase, partial [Gammaproteobacteria bacterium]